MNLVTRRHRVMAIIVGIALLVVVVLQIWRDGRRMQMEQFKANFQSTTK